MPDLGRLWSTTPVRLAVVYSAIFAIGILSLLGIVYVSALDYLEHQGDEIVLGQASMMALAPPAQLEARITMALRGDRRSVTYFGLFERDGRRIAGNVGALPERIARDGVPASLNQPGYQPGARGLIRPMPDGRLLFVGYDAKTLSGLRDIVLRALMLGGGTVLAAGIAIGFWFGIGPIRRLRAIGAAAARVREGELSVRLPRSGRGDELDGLVDLVNAMLGEVERLLEEVKSVGDNLAHDLRTPLGHLRADLHQAVEQLEREDVAGSRDRLTGAIAAADTLLDRFRAIQRIAEIDGRKRRAGIASFDLSALVREFGELYALVAQEKGLALTVDAPPAVAMLGDRELLAEALANLLDNAVKFTPAGGMIALSVTRSADRVSIAVGDSGPGIAPSEHALVVERFGRALRDRNVPGAGLGLAIVAAVARLHSMKLDLEDARPGLVVRLTGPSGLISG